LTWFELRREDASFVGRAPVVHVCRAEVAAPRKAVFGAFAEPHSWKDWFPGVRSAAYTSPPPHGVGSIREAEVGGTRWVEELIAWEVGTRWAYTVTRSSAPLAAAQVEVFEFADAGAGTEVRWTLACEPRLLMRLGAPVAPRVIRRVFERAAANLGARLRETAPGGC
jgi:carbon monoxide dehydrogenase subunit G